MFILTTSISIIISCFHRDKKNVTLIPFRNIAKMEMKESNPKAIDQRLSQQ